MRKTPLSPPPAPNRRSAAALPTAALRVLRLGSPFLRGRPVERGPPAHGAVRCLTATGRTGADLRGRRRAKPSWTTRAQSHARVHIAFAQQQATQLNVKFRHRDSNPGSSGEGRVS